MRLNRHPRISSHHATIDASFEGCLATSAFVLLAIAFFFRRDVKVGAAHSMVFVLHIKVPVFICTCSSLKAFRFQVQSKCATVSFHFCVRPLIHLTFEEIGMYLLVSSRSFIAWGGGRVGLVIGTFCASFFVLRAFEPSYRVLLADLRYERYQT